MMSATLLRKSMPMFAGVVLLLLGTGLTTTFTYGMVDDTPGADHTPIQAGYAVVTPSGGDPGALVVFETFGERRGSDTPQAGVFPSSLSKHFLLFVNMSGRLSRNMGVAIANPGGTPANNVVLTLRDNDGNPAADPKTLPTVDPGHQVAKMVTELFPDQASVPRDFVGTLDIASDVDVAVIGLRFRGMNFSTLPATLLGTPAQVPTITVGSDTIGGPEAVLLAHFVTGGGWATEIVLINTGTKELTFRVDLFDQNGGPLTAQLNGETNSTFKDDLVQKIPAGGVYVLSQRNPSGDSDF